MSEFRIEGNALYDDKGLLLARIVVRDGEMHVVREPRCSIGDDFAILTMLHEKGYRIS